MIHDATGKIARKVRFAAKRRGVRIADIGDALGKGRAATRRLWCGQTSYTLDEFAAVAAILDTDPVELLQIYT